MVQPDFYTDLDWLHRVCHRFDRFKRASLSSEVYNCRCPVCGDSQRDPKKARFYFYQKKGSMNVICHKCGYSHSFFVFMKDVCASDFEEYKKDQLLCRLDRSHQNTRVSVDRQQAASAQSKPEKPAETKEMTRLAGVVPLTSLDADHPALMYMKSRGLTSRQLDRLLYSEDFKVTAESISCEPIKDTFPTEPRVVIPFYDTEGNIEMIQGRSLSKSGLRYLSIKTDPNVDKIYGKYEADRSNTVYCVEGPIDSLFVDNCLATCDSNLLRANADVYIYDNQPRSREIIALMEQAISAGKKIVIWPTSPSHKEDINDMILSGMSQSDIMRIINKHTVYGLKAKLDLKRWRRV